MRLATVADLNALLGSSFGETDERPLRLLELASALVQGELGQTLGLVEGDVATLPAGEQSFYLPERPVLNLTTVIVNPPASYGVSYPLDVAQLTWYSWGGVDLQRGALNSWRWGSTVTVTYDHGYETIPDDIVSAVCTIVGRMVSAPVGAESESIMSYSVTYGENAWPPADRMALRKRYRPGSSSPRIRAAHEL